MISHFDLNARKSPFDFCDLNKMLIFSLNKIYSNLIYVIVLQFLSDTGAQLCFGLLHLHLHLFSQKALLPVTTHTSFCHEYQNVLQCITVSYSFPSSGTPWFDPWPATLQTWSVSIWTTLQIMNFENQIIMLISVMIISQIIVLISLLRRNGFPCVVPHMLPLGSKLPNYKSCFPN